VAHDTTDAVLVYVEPKLVRWVHRRIVAGSISPRNMCAAL
jgi:hypothetical protein